MQVSERSSLEIKVKWVGVYILDLNEELRYKYLPFSDDYPAYQMALHYGEILGLWKVCPSNRANAWKILIEATAKIAKKSYNSNIDINVRVVELSRQIAYLANKWKLTNEDAFELCKNYPKLHLVKLKHNAIPNQHIYAAAIRNPVLAAIDQDSSIKLHYGQSALIAFANLCIHHPDILDEIPS